MRKRSFISVLVLLIAAASLYSASFISSPAATVNLIRNTAITEEQLDEEYQRYVDMGAAGITKSDVLQTLINDEVFLQGAERDGISVSDRQVDQMYQQVKANAEQQAGGPISDADFEAEVVRQFGSVEAYRQALKEQTIINQYMMMKRGTELQNIPEPTEDEIAAFYRRNQQSFFQSENVKLAHIYIPKTDDEAQNSENKALLEDVATQIAAGEITFEKAVSQYSQDAGSKNVGGDIGWLTADNTVARQGWGDAFCDAVLSMDAGEISGMLESNTGYHIVKVSVHNDAKILTLDDPVSPEDPTTVRDYIRQVLLMQNYQTVYSQQLSSLIAELRSEAQINILYKG